MYLVFQDVLSKFLVNMTFLIQYDQKFPIKVPKEVVWL